MNKTRVVGQCEISHPVQPTLVVNVSDGGSSQEDLDSMGELLAQKKNVFFDADRKDAAAGLPSPVSSKSIIFLLHCAPSYTRQRSGIYYINAYGTEIHPHPNPDFLTSISVSQVLVYSCGSLWTRSGTLE